MIHTTLVLLVQGDPMTKVLLGYKKRGFGQGKYTGIGGKIENGESIRAAAVREMREETGIILSQNNLVDAGHLTFYFPARPQWDLTTQIFLAREWTGEPAESPEIKPKWFDVHNLPYVKMWDDATYWYARVLNAEYIKATFTFSDDCETVATCQMEQQNQA